MGAFGEVNEVYGELLRVRPAGARRVRRGRAAARRAGRDRRRDRPARLTPWPRTRGPSSADDVRAVATGAVEAVARRTPVLSTRTISERAGGTVVLKAENLQRTGSFKIRGAAAKVASLGDGGLRARRRRGVGRQPRPGAGRRRAERAAMPCEVFVPADAPIAKAEAARGARRDRAHRRRRRRRLHRPRARARARGRPDVRAPVRRPRRRGRAGLARARAARGRRPTWRRSSSRSAAAGWPAGIAIAVKSARPDVRVVGVQAAACAPYPQSFERGEPVPVDSALTIADGIAVKRPGELTLPLLTQWLDDLVVVGEDDDGRGDGAADGALQARGRGRRRGRRRGAARRAGHAGRRAARRSPCSRAATSTPALLAAVARRHENEAGRRLVLLTRVPDRPGGAGAPALAASPTPAPTSSTSRTCAKGIDLHVRETGGRARARDARARARRGGHGEARRRRLRSPRAALIARVKRAASGQIPRRQPGEREETPWHRNRLGSHGQSRGGAARPARDALDLAADRAAARDAVPVHLQHARP